MRLFAMFVAMSVVAVSCGSSATGDSQSEAVVDPDVAIAPGSSAVGAVDIDGTTVDYVTVVPEGFELGDTAPVLLALPPGSQDLGLTESVTNSVYRTEAVSRGWVVVSPAAPNGELYFGGSEVLIGGLLEWMAGWVDAEGGAPHLSGISNGGISAFRAAALRPDGFLSIVVFPGFPRSDEDKAALSDLAGVPVRMFAGETDTSWVESMQAAFDTLNGFDADVTFDVLDGEGHVMASLADGVRVFDELDALR